jgi:5-methyltetrahydropteroyltriglutamate--homocysteine methyltransferase
MTAKVPRADVVGSLLRPAYLLEVRAARDAGRLDRAGLQAVEDRAVLEAIALQEGCGLGVVTDGEYRRGAYYAGFTGAVEGFEPEILERTFQGSDGGHLVARLPAVVGKLRRRGSIAGDEFRFLRANVHGTTIPKVTLPSANLMARYWKPGRSEAAYPDQAAYVRDAAAILRAEIAELTGLGATYVQLDAPQYTFLADPRMRDRLGPPGVTPEAVLDQMIAVDSATIEGISSVTFGVHLCRGNYRGHWLAAGGYDPIAERLFRGLNAHRFLLEYDSERAGGFAPLRAVPRGKVVVLGLVTTKSGLVESADDLRRRVEDAARYLPLDQLAISPQCGFASDAAGNPLTWDEQRRKLETLVEVARRVWG